MVIQIPGLLVAHPGVATSAARIDPEDVLEAKVFPQSRVENLDGHRHELPTLGTNVGLVTAGSDVIVVCQIDIETQLFCKRPERCRVAKHLPVPGIGCIDRADFYTVWQALYYVLAESNSEVNGCSNGGGARWLTGQRLCMRGIGTPRRLSTN